MFGNFTTKHVEIHVCGGYTRRGSTATIVHQACWHHDCQSHGEVETRAVASSLAKPAGNVRAPAIFEIFGALRASKILM